MKSHLTQVRGLKFIQIDGKLVLKNVAPYTGAWIEIKIFSSIWEGIKVAPYTGAWIEIVFFEDWDLYDFVAPYTGAWIEISSTF